MKRNPSCKFEVRCHQKKTINGLAAMFLLAALTTAAPYLSAAKDKKAKSAESSKTTKGLPIQDLTEDEAILQALNRLGFGPRPGDVERVKEIGLQKWIDQQLHPDSVNDSGLNARLERFPTLKMSSAKLLDAFPEPKVAARREGVTVEEYRKEQQERMRSVMQPPKEGETQSETQNTAATQGSAQSDLQMADAMHMPNFEAMDNDLNANPA